MHRNPVDSNPVDSNPVDSNAVESVLGDCKYEPEDIENIEVLTKFINKLYEVKIQKENNKITKFNYDTEVIEQLGFGENKLKKLKEMLTNGRNISKGGWLKYIENIGGIGNYKNKNRYNIFYTGNLFDYYYKNNTWLSPEINIIKLFLNDILYSNHSAGHSTSINLIDINNKYKEHAEATKNPAYDFDYNFIQTYKGLNKYQNTTRVKYLTNQSSQKQ